MEVTAVTVKELHTFISCSRKSRVGSFRNHEIINQVDGTLQHGARTHSLCFTVISLGKQIGGMFTFPPLSRSRVILHGVFMKANLDHWQNESLQEDHQVHRKTSGVKEKENWPLFHLLPENNEFILNLIYLPPYICLNVFFFCNIHTLRYSVFLAFFKNREYKYLFYLLHLYRTDAFIVIHWSSGSFNLWKKKNTTWNSKCENKIRSYKGERRGV